VSWKATRNSLVSAGAILVAASPARAGWQTPAPFLAVVRMQDGALSPETFNFRTVIESLARPDRPRQGDCESGMTNARVEGHVPRWAERFAHQHDVLSEGHAELDPAATRAFVDGFARVCLKKVP